MPPLPLPLPVQEYDGFRGENGIGGWWISLLSAQKRSVGQERWWTKPDEHGRMVPVKQHVVTTMSHQGSHNAPSKSLPIWLFANGDMYLGEWNEHGPRNHAVEHGFGISYIENPNEEGLVYIGQWENGLLRNGYSFWLESSKIWMENRQTGSPIRTDVVTWGRAGRRPGIPFTYSGRFRNGFKSDPEAIVTLKDGTTRKGPWASNHPVGNWYHHDHYHPPPPPHHHHVVSTVATTTAAAVGGGRLLGTSSPREDEDEKVGPAATPAISAGSKKRKKKSSPSAAAASSSSSRTSRPFSGNNNADHDRTSSNTTTILGAHNKGGKVAIKQEEVVIELLDSSSDDDDEAHAVKQEQVEEEEEQQAAEEPTNNNNNNNTTDNDQQEDEARIQKIHDWLQEDVIGNNPKPGTMKMYACSLYDLGFESVEMITNDTKYLTEQHINSFEWMKPLHKQMMIDYLYGNDI